MYRRSVNFGVLYFDEFVVDLSVVLFEEVQALLEAEVLVLLLDDLLLELHQLFIHQVFLLLPLLPLLLLFLFLVPALGRVGAHTHFLLVPVLDLLDFLVDGVVVAFDVLEAQDELLQGIFLEVHLSLLHHALDHLRAVVALALQLLPQTGNNNQDRDQHMKSEKGHEDYW